MQSNRLTLVAPLSILLVASSVNYACTNDNDDTPAADAGVYIDGGIQYGVPVGAGTAAPGDDDDTTGDDDTTDGGTSTTDGGGTTGDGGGTVTPDSGGGTTYSTPVSPSGTAFAVLVIGNGTATIDTSPTTTNAAYINYYTADGKTLTKSVTLPSTNPTAVTVASSLLDGQISLSGNGKYLLIPGYNLSVNQTINKAGERVIGRLDSSGTTDVSTVVSGMKNTENVRGVASADGVTLFASGSASGVFSVPFQGTTSTLVSAVPADARGLNVYGATLYAGAGDSPSYGLFSTPVTGATTMTLVSGWVTTGTPMPTNSTGFDSDGNGSIDIIYAADEKLGLQKWALSGTSWSLVETFPSTLNAVAVSATVVANTATVFVTLAPTIATTGVFSVTDAFANTTPATPTEILVGTAKTSYRGLAFPPSGI